MSETREYAEPKPDFSLRWMTFRKRCRLFNSSAIFPVRRIVIDDDRPPQGLFTEGKNKRSEQQLGIG